MNKNMQEPWLWPFGRLATGFEYLCVLDYRYDPKYKLQRHFCNELRASVNTSGRGLLSLPSLKRRLGPRSPKLSADLVNYNQLQCYMTRCSLECDGKPGPCEQEHASAWSRSIRKPMLAAQKLLAIHGRILVMAMDAKPLPENLWWIDMNGHRPLPDHLNTWLDLKRYLRNLSPRSLRADSPLDVKLSTLQAIHFKDLLDRQERIRKEGLKRHCGIDTVCRQEQAGQRRNAALQTQTEETSAEQDVLRDISDDSGNMNSVSPALETHEDSSMHQLRLLQVAEPEAVAVISHGALSSSEISTEQLVRPKRRGSSVDAQWSGSTLQHRTPSACLLRPQSSCVSLNDSVLSIRPFAKESGDMLDDGRVQCPGLWPEWSSRRWRGMSHWC